MIHAATSEAMILRMQSGDIRDTKSNQRVDHKEHIGPPDTSKISNKQS